MTTISAREFNQKVSRIRKAATHEPVFITERGEPKHVLLSIEAYEALMGGQRNIADLLALDEDAELDLPERRDTVRPVDFD